MAVTTNVYNSQLRNLFRGTTAYLTDTIVATLHDSGGKFNPEHSRWEDVAGSEVSTDTYADYPGETALSSKTVTTSSNVTMFDSATISFGTSVTIAADYMIIRDQSNDVLLFHVDFGGTQTSSSGNFQLQIHTNGIFRIGKNTFS
tara:strand:+ start:3881 stop:4315 length:435 start_codon:yes stop_codon:yes gene_type:complete